MTGFGLVGHATEIARASGVTLAIDAGAVPIFTGVLAIAAANRSGGLASNLEHFGGGVRVSADVDAVRESLLYDPQTSGGLLVAASHGAAEQVEAALREAGVLTARIGKVEAAAARVLERHPRIDLLVNNAGLGARGSFLTAEPERIEEVVRVNYLGSAWTVLAFLPGLGKGSHLVNVVSVAGTVALPPSGPYAASKHAQLAFSRSVAAQLRPRGVRVHTVLPGFSPTAGFPEPSVLPKLLEWTIIHPDRIARTIVRSVTQDRRESFVPWWFRSVAVLQGSVPGLFSRGLTWFARRFVRQPGPTD